MAGAANGSGRAVLRGANLTTGAMAISRRLPDPQPRLVPSGPADQDGEEASDVVYYHWSWDDEPGADNTGSAAGPAHNGSWPRGVGGSKVAGGIAGTKRDSIAGAVNDIEAANSALAVHFVWLLSILAVLLLLTVLGNALVCVVYRTRFRRNTTSCFVIFLSLLLLVFMIMGVPMEMSTLALPLLFRSAAACRVIRYVETAEILSLLLTLTAISVDRFCKLTRPSNFLTLAWVKCLCVVAVVLGLVLATPATIVFGTSAVTVSLAANMTGALCGVANDVHSQTVKLVYVMVLLVTYSFALITMAVLYILIYVRICRRKAASRGERVSPAWPIRHRFVAEDSTSSCGGGGEETRRFPTSSSNTSTSMMSTAACPPPRSGRTSPGVDPARVPLKASAKESARIGQGAGTVVDVQSTRMTWIFFLVSLFALILTAPFVVLRSLQVITNFMDTMEPIELAVVYEVAMRLYLLHPPIVPFLYLLCNHNFLREVKLFLLKVGRSCKRQPSSPPRTNNAG